MGVSIWVYAFLVIVLVRMLPQTDGLPNNREGHSAEYRTRRMARHIIALGRLLQNAILIKTRKNFILYKKAGGKRQAKKDFRTFEYTKTEANGEFGKVGIANDYAVFLSYPSGSRRGDPYLLIESMVKQADGSTQITKRKVVYQK